MNQSSAIRFTDAESESAKNTDLPNLLSSLGYHITVKGRYHSTTEINSLRIKSRKTWFRYSEQVGGDAITFLQHFHNMSFPDAVKYLLAFNGETRPHLQNAHMILPRNRASSHLAFPNRAPTTVESLPLLKRGIAKQVVGAFLSSGLLYEDTPYHN